MTVIDSLLTAGFPFKTQGFSMKPLILPNDYLYLKKVKYKAIRINDILLVKKTGEYISHRVIYKSARFLVTKGDNSLNSDDRILPKQVMAKVIKIERDDKIFNLKSVYALQSTLYLNEIEIINRCLKKAHVDFVFLKGLPLHLYYENHYPKRLFLDCDVLVSKKDFSVTDNLLRRMGYRKSDTSLSNFQKKLKDKNVEIAYYKKINGFPVVFDLHFEAVFMMTQLGKLNNLYPQEFIDQLTEECLRKKEKIIINKNTYPILNPQLLIIYLALHFFHHNFRGAFRLKFLDNVVRKNKLDPIAFTQIRRTIRKYQLQNFVYPSFVLLEKLYKTPLLESFLASIQPSNIQLHYLSSVINHPSSIFDDQTRVRAGVNRFKNLFLLSPQPLWKKLQIVFNYQVIYSIYWTIKTRLSSFFIFKTNASKSG